MIGISFNHPMVIDSEVFILDHDHNWITVDGPVMVISLERFSEEKREEFKNNVFSTYNNLYLNQATS